MPDAKIRLDLRRGEPTFVDPIVTELIESDDQGAFGFRTPSGGVWTATLTARIPDHVAAAAQVTIRADGMPEAPVVVVHPLDATRLVRIVDSNGRPIEGAEILIRQNDETILTDDAGQAVVRVSRSFGRLRAVIKHREYAAVVRSIDAWRGEGPQHLEFVLPGGFGISGAVRDRAGRPVAGVIVRLVTWTGLRTTTDDEGGFVLNGLDPTRGEQRLTFRHPDYLPGVSSIDATRGRLPLEISLKRGIDVCGRVESPDGEPLIGALVTLGTDKRVGRSMRTTDASGGFCVGAPVRGDTMLRVSYPGLVPHISEITAEPDAEPIVVRLASGNRFGGRVLDTSGRPVSRAFLGFYVQEPRDLDRRTQTDEEGYWQIDGVPSFVHVSVERYGYLGVTKRDVPTGRRNFDITLVRSGGIEGRVIDSSGQPVPRFRVAMTPPRTKGKQQSARPPGGWGLPGKQFENEDGRFTSGPTPLRPGEAYRIEISAEGFQTAFLEPYLPTLQPRNDPVTVRLRPGGDADGAVIDESGRPIEGAVVALRSAFNRLDWRVEQGPRAATDKGGGFTLRGLPTGRVEVEVRHQRYAPVKHDVVITRGRISPIPIFVLTASGGLTVNVRLPPNTAMPATQIELGPRDGSQSTIHPMTGTELSLPWVRAGMYTLTLKSSDADLNGLSSTVEIAQGRSRRVVFHPVPPRCDLTGRVTIDGQAPNHVVSITLSRVLADNTVKHHSRQNTRRDGSFAFPNLEPGPWRIDAAFTSNGTRRSGGRQVSLQPALEPVEIALRTR